MTWGPNDLEFSLDLHPDFPLRTVEACMQNVAEQLRQRHPHRDGDHHTADERQKYRELGVTIFMAAP